MTTNTKPNVDPSELPDAVGVEVCYAGGVGVGAMWLIPLTICLLLVVFL